MILDERRSEFELLNFKTPFGLICNPRESFRSHAASSTARPLNPPRPAARWKFTFQISNFICPHHTLMLFYI